MISFWMQYKHDPNAMNRYPLPLPPVQVEMFKDEVSFIYPVLRKEGNHSERATHETN